MFSKLKIIVDYPCEIFCDYILKGQALPNSIFIIELRKGTYFLEFKINNEVHESFDYIMASNEQEDLLRISLLSEISFSITSINHKSRILRDNDTQNLFCGKVYIKWNTTDKEQSIGTKENKKTFFKKACPHLFHIVLKESFTIEAEDDNEEIIESNFTNSMDIPIHFDTNHIPNNIIIDTKFLHSDYSSFYGKIVIYDDSRIVLCTINSNKVIETSILDLEIGFLYNISKDYILTIKDKKFGIYNLSTKQIICSNKFDALYNDDVDFRGEIYRYFFSTDKYIVEHNGKQGIINSRGESLLPCIYDEAHTCCLGYIIKRGENWGLSSKGEEPKDWYNDIFAIYETSYGITKTHFSVFDIEDFETTEIVPYHFGSCIVFFRVGNKYGYWDFEGKQSRLLYDEIVNEHRNYLFGSSIDRLISVKVDNKIGYIDCYGQEIIPCKYEEIINFKTDPFIIAFYCDYKLLYERGIKTKFIKDIEEKAYQWYGKDKSDRSVVMEDIIINYLGYHELMSFIAKLKGKYGVDSIEGINIISFIYDSIKEIFNHTYLVEKDGLFGILESNEEIIKPIAYKDADKLVSDFYYEEGMI